MINMDEVKEVFVNLFEEKSNLFGCTVQQLCCAIEKNGSLSYKIYQDGNEKAELKLGADILKTKNPAKTLMVGQVLNILLDAFRKDRAAAHGDCADEDVVVEITLPKIEWYANYVQKINHDHEMKTNRDSSHASRALADARRDVLSSHPLVEVATIEPYPPLIFLYKRGHRKEGRIVEWSELEF